MGGRGGGHRNEEAEGQEGTSKRAGDLIPLPVDYAAPVPAFVIQITLTVRKQGTDTQRSPLTAPVGSRLLSFLFGKSRPYNRIMSLIARLSSMKCER
ncbi:hypothetical protein EVAR_22073_1 [Eumeta japonica]|uniref:Uncharacterized protein n=1 Tax=Eumeta variegata TaxID=151549 RepID=A0A4C1USM1_EUMVA|nr:hypothetical protein EVAR_22073_1 [Eumeta japonica]